MFTLSGYKKEYSYLKWQLSSLALSSKQLPLSKSPSTSSSTITNNWLELVQIRMGVNFRIFEA